MGHDGKQRNSPAVRFGNIAMRSTERIESPYGLLQESFIVETHSLPGYSGSAVLLFAPFSMGDMSRNRFGKSREHYQNFDLLKGQQPDLRFMNTKGPYLLGIDWCHLHNKLEVKGSSGNKSKRPVKDVLRG